MEPVIRPIVEGELEEFGRVASTGFGHRFDAETFVDASRAIEVERALAAFDGKQLVGTAEAMSTDLSVPGGAHLPAAGIKGITVLPTHRRRGILTRLMQRQLADLAERGEPLALLWATESPIYARFGYGVASYRMASEIDKVHATLAPGHDADAEADDHDFTVELVESADERRAIADEVYEAKRVVVPGMIRRTPPFWIRRRDLLGDSHFFVAVADATGRLRAYASYAIEASWGEVGPDNLLVLGDVIALDPDAERALWRYLLNIDLVTRISAWFRPVDDPLPHLLRDPRRLRRTLGEGAWLRIIDLPAALATRRYMADVDVTLNVTDPFLPSNSGNWRLQGDASGATCSPTAEKADLELDISTLASAFLGHPSLGSPAAAGLVVEHRSGALRQAAAAFCWSPAPWAVTWF